jgi:hypothetical protein
MSGDVTILRGAGRAAPQASDTPAQEGPDRHGPEQAESTPDQAQPESTPDQSAAMGTDGATKEGEAR